MKLNLIVYCCCVLWIFVSKPYLCLQDDNGMLLWCCCKHTRVLYTMYYSRLLVTSAITTRTCMHMYIHISWLSLPLKLMCRDADHGLGSIVAIQTLLMDIAERVLIFCHIKTLCTLCLGGSVPVFYLLGHFHVHFDLHNTRVTIFPRLSFHQDFPRKEGGEEGMFGEPSVSLVHPLKIMSYAHANDFHFCLVKWEGGGGGGGGKRPLPHHMRSLKIGMQFPMQ